MSKLEERENTNNKSTINEYKILIILIVLSIIFGLIVLIIYLNDSSSIILFSLGFGLAMEIHLLYIMIRSLKSEVKWSVIVDFNYHHEGIFELILSFVLIIIGIIAIVKLL